MWIIHEPQKVALWNKRHFEEKNRECAACLKYSVLIFVEKIYIKCNIWRVAVRRSYIWDARFLKVKGYRKHSCFRELYKTNYLIEWLAISHGCLWQMYQRRKKSFRYCCRLWSRPRTFQTTHILSLAVDSGCLTDGVIGIMFSTCTYFHL